MGLTQDVGKIWNKLSRRSEIDSAWMQEELHQDTGITHPRNRISGVLHRFIKAGCAKKGKIKGSYKKIRNFKPRRVIPKLNKEGLLDISMLDAPIIEEKKKKEIIEPLITEPAIDLLTLGQSILTIIDDLKAKITELRLQLSEERKTIGELVEEKRHLEELYKKAQTRILELNTGSKGKSVSLSELQNFRDELPEKGK